MDRIELLSGERHGIAVDERPVDRVVYCNLSDEAWAEFEVGFHIWAKNLIDPSERNPHKGEDRERWEAWISLGEYNRLLGLLEELSFDEYDDVNRNSIAYTNCLSHTAVCFVCGVDLTYREDDVVSLTRGHGPIYCHPDCVDEFCEVIQSVEDEIPNILAGFV